MELQPQQPQNGLQPPYSSSHNLLEHLSASDPHPSFLPPNHITVPSTTILPTNDLPSYLTRELLLPHLTPLYSYLKYASQPSHIRPLHQRRADNHQVIIDERPDWHLVCWRDGLCIKPLPAFLLDHDFFTTHIAPVPDLHAAACGYLLTWTELIRHHSDFRVAQDLGLVPDGVPWPAFAHFLADMRHRRESLTLHPRYEYGELWLKELCVLGWWVNGWEARYFHLFSDYVTFGLANYAQLLAAFAVVGLLLSALQVGLATDQGLPPGWFADMSWGLAVVSCLVVAGSGVGFVIFLACNYTWNMVVALKYDRIVRKGGAGSGGRWEVTREKAGIA